MRVLIVDDDALIRDSLKIILSLEYDFEVVGTAENGLQAFELCKKDQPDCILMDIRMPVLDGVLGTKMIKESFPNVKIVLLTTFKDDEYIKEAVKCGAEGYILKSQSSDSIIESLRTVAKGNIVFEKEVASILTSMIHQEKKEKIGHYGLTDREMDVLKLIAEGMSNKEISEKLFLSEGTVRNYVTTMLEKLNLRDRTQLAIFYIKHH